MTVPQALALAVRGRAGGRCQYCLMHESLQGATFHIEHVVPQAKGGPTILDNLALACPGCNLHKGARTMGFDPVSGETVPLFHPIQQIWPEHFRFQGYEIGLTPTGRATVLTLVLNYPRRQLIRQVEDLLRPGIRLLLRRSRHFPCTERRRPQQLEKNGRVPQVTLRG